MSEYHFAEIMRALSRIEKKLKDRDTVARLSEGGKKGGSRKVPKGFAKLTKKRRREIARRAAAARWPQNGKS